VIGSTASWELLMVFMHGAYHL